jgi:TonB family protein
MSLEEMPEYPDGFDALAKFIVDTLKYPQSAIDDSVSGRVFTKFTVDPNGKVKDVKTLRGLRADLDSACVWVISIMPDWKKPGKLNGKAVSVSMVLPIRFVIED